MDLDPFPFLVVSETGFHLVWIQFLLAIILIICSALISGAEVAFFSLQLKALEDPDENGGDPAVQRIVQMLRKPKRLLATILVANNFINIAIVLIFSILGEELLPEFENPYILLFIEVGIITSLILIFGEILPKVYANRNALAFSKLIAPWIYGLDHYILFWITKPMSKITSFLERRLGDSSQQQFSVDRLSQALELTGDDETTNDEQRILEGIINFGNTETREVMCPRMDMFALSDNQTLDEIIPIVVEQGYSRIPVYNEKKDNIKGILYIKDLLPHLNESEYYWQQHLKTPIYVPENKKLDDLLKVFQHKKIHMAIVVDEYGGTSGLITLEDIMEEIVGDISDEFDDVDLRYTKIDNYTYTFEAKISLKDFFKAILIEDTSVFDAVKGDAESLAGLLLEIAKKFPKRGQKIKFNGFVFTVEELDQMRIKQIKVVLPKENEQA